MVVVFGGSESLDDVDHMSLLRHVCLVVESQVLRHVLLLVL